MRKKFVLTTGTREEPIERPLTNDTDMSELFYVFIDGRRHRFASAVAYYKWAGKSLVHPLAPNLLRRLPDRLPDIESSSESDGEPFADDEWGVATTGGNWGDDVE